MSCKGRRGDYYCPAWRTKARAIRRRDHNRCRDCGRRSKLEVHHLRYGTPGGPCGRCVLLSVPDDVLISLCGDCHDRRHGRIALLPPLPPVNLTPIRFILSKLRKLF
jgi:5-methylcytosine-specific restriction endonuclease McrA